MKKNLFVGLIAMTALTVTSCTNDEVVEAIPQKQAIEFGTYLGRDAQARGLALNETNGQTFNKFGVFAYYTGQDTWEPALKPMTEGEEGETTSEPSWTPNFMYNQKVSATGSGENITWSYSPLKYWPTTKGDMITFFAYAPMAPENNEDGNGISITGKTATGTPKVTYTIDPENLENMADFVADALIDQKRTSNKVTLDNNPEPLTFVLNHELTRVNIQAKLSADAFGDAAANKTKVNITDIEFVGSGFATTGVYTFANTSENDVRGTWSYTAVQTPFSIFDTNNIDANFVKKAAASGLGDYEEVGVSIPTTKTVDLFADYQYLFLIPANGTDGITNAKNVSMYVSYDIVTADANLTGGYSKTSAVKEIVLPDNLLKQGTAYNIVLTFGMNEITLSASVDDWSTAADDEHNVDYPKTDK